MTVSQKVPTSDFQSEFSMSRIIRIFLVEYGGAYGSKAEMVP